jgi:hypothetical protein
MLSYSVRVGSALAATLVFLALVGPQANAGQTHVFLEAFGSAAEPSFSGAIGAAVDQSTGDVLVIEAGTQQISRYHADGTPSDFSALGTNTIDAKGTGQCSTVPADCDQTPENGFSFDPSFGYLYTEIAVDSSGTVTDGNIYVTQSLYEGSLHLIDIFSSTGRYLGQLTGAGATSFGSGPAEEGGLSPCGVAVDPAGNVYVAGWLEDKIYKFDPAAAASAPVNTDHVATFSSQDPCSLAAGAGPSAGSLFVTEYVSDVSKISASSGAFQYLVKGGDNTQVSVNPGDGHVFVADGGSIAEYDASGSSGATLVSTFGSGSFVAVDGSSGKVYVPGGEEGKLHVYGPLVPLPDPITTAASNIGKSSATLNGTVETHGEELTECSFEYGTTTAYGATVPCAESPAEIGTGTKAVHADVSGLDAEAVYHYRLVAANPNGPPVTGDDQAFQTAGKPELLGVWAQDVTLHEATLKATINPQSSETTYRFEWGPTSFYGSSSGDISIGSEPVAHTVSLFLDELAAGTTYHFRVVSENEVGTSVSPDHAFVTARASSGPDADCPNQAFRTADSAFLPDCRAYELVSPVDKNGGHIALHAEGNIQASRDGEKITYTAIPCFGDQPNCFAGNQYLAARQEGAGWSSHGIHPPVVGRPVVSDLHLGITREFTAFTPDLCDAWLVSYLTPSPTPDGQEGFSNLYRRDNCEPGEGSLETLTQAPPPLPEGTSKTYVDGTSVQGVSDDSRHAIFLADAKLNDDAAEGFDPQVYDRFGGEVHLVSVLPDGSASETPSGVGSGWTRNLDNAVSSDGSRVYWTSGPFAVTFGTGQIYLRLHPEQGVVDDECSAPEKACTVPVSTGDPLLAKAFFWTAAADGSKALYSEGSLEDGTAELYEFDLGRARESRPPRLIAENVEGVAGASDDLERVYFVSRDKLSLQRNSEDAEAEAGKPNLYLAEDDTVIYVATLGEGDVGKPEPGKPLAYDIVAGESRLRTTRVTPDGAHIAFLSRAPLTGYDNTDADNGKTDVEVFAYKAGGELLCVSCDPSGGRPSGGRELRRHYWATDPGGGGLNGVFAAAWIPPPEQPLYASNVLSDDGERLFFNSNDALLPRDTNATMDVYEWEAPGRGGCDTGDGDYFAANGGCLYLISSGESPFESEFWEASPDGEDVFFTTESSLLPQDPGLIDLYDARVGGGFAQAIEKAPCEGEACQSPPPPPGYASGASATYNGPHNARPRKRRCRRKKRRVRRAGKVRCVKRKGKARHGAGRRGHRSRRAAR